MPQWVLHWPAFINCHLYHYKQVFKCLCVNSHSLISDHEAEVNWSGDDDNVLMRRIGNISSWHDNTPIWHSVVLTAPWIHQHWRRFRWLPHATGTLCRPRWEECSHWRRSDTAWKQNYSIPALPDCLTALSTCVFNLILYSALATAIAVSRHYNHSCLIIIIIID